MLVYLRDGSAQTSLCAVYTEIEVAIFYLTGVTVY